jgi:hypothetical protein
MVDDRDELAPAEREALNEWGKDWEPPASLRHDTLRALRDRGLLGGAPHRPRAIAATVAWAVAAAAVAFIAGFALRGRTGAMVGGPRPGAPAPAVVSAQSHYMLLLFESGDYRAAPTAERQVERVREYSGWARAVAESGRYITGEELARDGRWCRISAGRLEVLPPRPDSERGMLGGYFVIGAASYDDAVNVARGCPHLRHGGTVEVRRVEG